MKTLITGLLSATLILGCMDSSHSSDHGSNSEKLPSIVEGKFTQALVIPATQSIDQAQISAQIQSGSTDRLGYSNGGILGPTLIGKTGQKVQIQLTNRLSEGTNLHWHGLEVPVDQDGLPENSILPGQSKNYDFTIKNRAGMYWYHPHLMGSTARQAYQGLAGLILIRDAEEDSLHLPSGEYELPLVVQDRRANHTYQPNMDEIMSGFMGDHIEVNGIASPIHQVKKGVYRLRILNGSNARVYDFALSDHRMMTLIGSDGGLLPQAQSVDHLLLGPGERADVLVSFEKDPTANELYLISQNFSGGNQGSQSFKVMKFKVLDAVGTSYTVPAQLSKIEAIPSTSQNRTFALAMASSMNSGSMGMHTINGQIYDSKRIEAQIKAGSVEQWKWTNNTHEIHPIHIHGVQFQVIERSVGRTALPQEKGWKDTFVLLPMEQATIAIRFSSELGRHLFHCHNLEHEEDGMMLQYEIIP